MRTRKRWKSKIPFYITTSGFCCPRHNSYLRTFQRKRTYSSSRPFVHRLDLRYQTRCLGGFLMLSATAEQQSWAYCHILQSRSTPKILKLGPIPTMVQKVCKMWSTSPNKVQKINKIKNFRKKCRNFFPLTHSKSGPDPKFLKQFTVRKQPIPSPIQCSSLQDSSINLDGCVSFSNWELHGWMLVLFTDKFRNFMKTILKFYPRIRLHPCEETLHVYFTIKHFWRAKLLALFANKCVMTFLLLLLYS